MSLFLDMKQIKDLSPSERHIVDYIFENLHEVVNIGIVELAQKTFTSTSTVKRLCKKLGINSYIDFRLQLSTELSSYMKSSILKRGKEPVGRYDSIEDIIKKVSNQNAKSIIDSSVLNKVETFEKVISMMRQAKTIDFYGIGPSNFVALDAQVKFMRLGIPTSAYGNHIEMLINAKSSSPDRLAFLISYTGETEDILTVAQELSMLNVPKVSLTSLNENSLMKLCEVNLFVDASETWNRLGGMSSRISTLSVVDILVTALINSDFKHYYEIIEKTYTGKRPTSVSGKGKMMY